MQTLTCSFILLFTTASSFFSGVSLRSINKFALNVATIEKPIISAIQSPDFYWEYRLERLANRQESVLPYNRNAYPDVSGFKDLYDAYYLDLTLQGKLAGFDWEAEKLINDTEWLTIFNKISKWSKTIAKANKLDNTNVPSSDIDLLKQFYPQINVRELETPFSELEVGENFPYRTTKDMYNAASEGKLSVPGYSKSVTSLEATTARAELEVLKTSSLKKIDAIFEKTLAYAAAPFPDEEAKTHYRALKAKLADFPQTPAGWDSYRVKLDKEIDEMAILASKKDEAHHHHHEEEEGEESEHKEEPHVSPAEEFEIKYGRNLEELQERMSKFKSNPVTFLENSIVEKFGKNGLDIWKKSQEFSAKLNVISAEERLATEKSFSDFLNQA